MRFAMVADRLRLYFRVRLDDRFHESCHNGGDSSRFSDSYIGRVCPNWGSKVMAAWRRAIELSLGDEDTAKLKSIAQSRTEPASRVERARILLAYREDPSFFAVGRALGLHHQTVQRCVERAVVEGPIAALDDRPRPVGSLRSHSKPRHGWCRWRGGRRRNLAIPTDC